MIEYEHKYLKDVLIPLKKGAIKKTDIVLNGKYPILNSSRDYFGYFDKYNNDDKSIIITSHGAYAGFVSYIEGKYWAGSLCFPYKSKNENLYNSKYIFHYLKNNEQLNMEKIVLTGSIPYINKTELELLKIPFPPMEVQNEIVEVLDKFSALEAELEAELEARIKQYEYYRDDLLNQSNSKKMKLKEVLKIKNGKDYKKYGKGNYPVYGTGGIMTHIDHYAYDKPSVLIPRKGSLDKLYYLEKPFWTVDTLFYTEIYDCIAVPKFIYYYLEKERLEQYNTAGGVPSLTQTILNEIEILIPSLHEQEHIVSILDKFSTLITDIKEGLPAEIELRRKQYEYYRNKLLTFDKE